ncbi:uncharacterized protein LOC143031965 [Oratosquilla oratoria]|uniref:uncharacterized protein LOC143031965 n=1 Tax=Oratosquilla oratoria TaxID=337810 RepID=UPI003F772541
MIEGLIKKKLEQYTAPTQTPDSPGHKIIIYQRNNYHDHYKEECDAIKARPQEQLSLQHLRDLSPSHHEHQPVSPDTRRRTRASSHRPRSREEPCSQSESSILPELGQLNCEAARVSSHYPGSDELSPGPIRAQHSTWTELAEPSHLL